MKRVKAFFLLLRNILNNYPVVVAAVAIYGYYLFTSINLFAHIKEKKSLFDYIVQFDSLIWMWLAVAALLQIQKYRKRQLEETEEKQLYRRELERQKIQNELLNDITSLLQDNINNPLTIISLRVQELRRRIGNDREMMGWMESIEGAMRRIQQTVRDLKAYELQRMVDASEDRVGKSPSS